MTTLEERACAAVIRRHLHLGGVVQGVGFRPHVARLARELGLAGRCWNEASGIDIDVEGPSEAVAEFTDRVIAQAPPLARVTSVATHDSDVAGTTRQGHFAIEISRDGAERAGASTCVPPDVAVCDDCLSELRDPADRRYGHPFITCTNCGPRASIILDVPYDRSATTMTDFAMCQACAREYADPLDRRFHAQPISCHDCGPTLRFTDETGAALAVRSEALDAAVHSLMSGQIVAIKGIGGVHLACDAGNADTVARLRARKGRPDRPFAVMAADVQTAHALAELSAPAVKLLTSPARPIVLADARPSPYVADTVAPHLHEVGVLLPYAPLHHLLFGDSRTPRALVMTSGNAAGEPLCHDDGDSLERLRGIADAFLLHDRRIHTPYEDSVMALDEGRPLPVRRSRGYAPLPIALAADCDLDAPGQVVLAAGAEVKNTFAVLRGQEAFISAHIGDLDSVASRRTLQRSAIGALHLQRASPASIVADAHPGYASRAWAADLADSFGVPLIEVQHHHAHLAALAAEHDRLGSPLLGIVFDGTGFGDDSTIWGGEILLLDEGGATAQRLGHLATFPLPGGDAGVRNPVRMAAAALLHHDIAWPATIAAALDEGEARMMPRLLRGDIGWVATSSAGRLFDVVAAMLAVRSRVSYEAQAAIELEALARTWARAHQTDAAPTLAMPTDAIDGVRVIGLGPLLSGIAQHLDSRGDVGAHGSLAWAFHDALARAAATTAADLARARGLTEVGLTGGVFGNRLLLERCRHHLATRGIDALTHRLVPPNDGGLSLGQGVVGVARLRAATAHTAESVHRGHHTAPERRH